MRAVGRRSLLLAVCCLAVLALAGDRTSRHRIAGATETGRPMPILRLAIDNDYYPEKQSVAQAARDFVLLHSIGVRILRVGIGWDDTNPAPGVYDRGFWRAFVCRAAAAGIDVRPYYLYPPSWAADYWNDPPRNPEDYGPRVRSVGPPEAPLGALLRGME